ncbi:MAG: methyltransferase domain-containing protein [Acetobacteraceae bacterium]
MADYFVVGPTIALQGEVAPGTLPILRVRTPGNKNGPRVSAVLESGRVRLDASPEPLPSPARIEALRLLARVAERLAPPILPLFISAHSPIGGPADLAADGFSAVQDGWIRERGPFLRKHRTDSLDEVYRDPFTVPWNFVPRELDCMQPILEAASPSPADFAVLDLGFGFGKNATFLESRGFAVSGIEISQTATRRVREFVKHPGRFHNASAASMPFADESFDAVLDVGCLHCMPAEQRSAAISEMHRVLRPGGLVSSRIFRPCDRAWVARQPFLADSFGLSDADAAALFHPLLQVHVWRDAPDMIYLCGRRAAA